MPGLRPHLLTAVLCGAVLTGCGAGSATPASQDTGDSAAATLRADRRPALPPGWRRVVNPRAGFSLALPPGWRARGARGATILNSADRALAASVAADRSDQGARLALAAYARRTATSLPGYRGLRTAAPRRVTDTPDATVSVAAVGRLRRTRVRQQILLFAIRRPGVTFTLIFFRSAATPAARYAFYERGIVRSLRAQEPAL